MEIREGNNCVTIEPVDRVPADLPSAGDVELSVEVASEQFSGPGFAWVAGPALAAFLAQLRELDTRRQGEAVVEGLSPEEFRLRLWSIDRRGSIIRCWSQGGGRLRWYFPASEKLSEKAHEKPGFSEKPGF
jgi:hypothetical protein